MVNGPVMRCLPRMLMVLWALLPVSCGRSQAPAAQTLVSIPPPRPDRSNLGAPEPALRFVKRLGDRYSEARFYRDAGIVTRCGEDEDACLLGDGGKLAPAADLKRFVDPPSTVLSSFISMSGPWPRRAWTAERLGPVTDGAVALNVYSWTQEGWKRNISLTLTDGDWFPGAGEWTGGRIIMPVIHFDWDDRRDRPIFAKWSRFQVLSGPPADNLPLLEEDPTLYPQAFASLPSGHAFLAYRRWKSEDLVVHRWGPGDRRPAQDDVAGARAMPGRDVNNETFWWEGDPTREILAISPDEVYVAGRDKRLLENGDLVIAQFDGRAWQVSLVPSEHQFIGLSRGPDGSVWVVCADMFFRGHPDGELWRRRPGDTYQRIELPPIRIDGEVVEVAPMDVWPRGVDEVWITALYGPRVVRTHEPLDYGKYAHGLFLLKPSALDAAAR